MKYLLALLFMPLIVSCASSSAPQLVKVDKNAGIIVWTYIPGPNMAGHNILGHWELNDVYCKQMGFAGVVFNGSYTDKGLLRNTSYYPCISQAEFSAYGAKTEGSLITVTAQPFYTRAYSYANASAAQIQNGTQLLQSVNSQFQQQYNRNGQQSQPSGGVLMSETISGFNKICFYNNSGSTYAITIRSTQLCPLIN